MKRKIRFGALALSLLVVCTACATAQASNTDETLITLADGGITVDGAAAITDPASAVYVGARIVYYEDGKDETYGEGTEADSHSAAEAAAHTVVTITQPGTYRLTGALSAGQVAVDLGDGAETDPTAVVTLILDNANITCAVAPAVLFYRVYECGPADAETATATVDTAKAGANVIIADGTENNVSGSYVAKIYKEGTGDKLHKYDGAFYAKTSMNVAGGDLGTGVLNLTAENEGLDSELHLTINGGIINITAQNDGINTSEDGLSVATVNGGTITINAGLGAEGDGIDSNGFLVVNGGTITALANPTAGDGGLDAESVIINGGTVFATGTRNDAIDASSGQHSMALRFSSTVAQGSTVTLKDTDGVTVLEFTAQKEFQSAVLSSSALKPDVVYHLYVNGTQQQYTGTDGGVSGGGFGGQRPEGMEPPVGAERPEGSAPPVGATPPEGMTAPEGMERPAGGGSGRGEAPSGTGTPSVDFTLTSAVASFSGIVNQA